MEKYILDLVADFNDCIVDDNPNFVNYYKHKAKVNKINNTIIDVVDNCIESNIYKYDCGKQIHNCKVCNIIFMDLEKHVKSDTHKINLINEIKQKLQCK